MRARVFLITYFLVTLISAQEVLFNRDIRPILSNKCFFCHGPDEKKREADLRLDTREGATADHDGFFAIVPGKPEDSEILIRIAHDQGDDIMPPPESKKGRLTEAEISLIERWIQQGATYQDHWSFEPLSTTTPPADWIENPIDYYINATLAQLKIQPSPLADRSTLIRRVSLDLTGLLPTPEQTASFIADKRPDAYERLVDELLSSPHYGERWGRHWLDQARYADSHGYAVDGERQMWPYRDWVIKALNDDLPFDQFTIEQLAGDLLPNRTKSQLIASAFHRNTLINQEGGTDREQFRVESVIDRVNTTGAVWLGLTVGCAQCHTHKFDPITHREYYELFAFFNSTEDANNTGPTVDVEQFEILNNSPAPRLVDQPNQPTRAVEWQQVKNLSSQTKSGTRLKKLKDHSLLLELPAQPKDSYTLSFRSNLEQVAAFRLRTLPDQSLPNRGPGTAGNGNFVLTNVTASLEGKPIRIKAAFADHEQAGYPAAATIDQDSKSGWAINVAPGQKTKMNAEHEIILIFENPVIPKGKEFIIKLDHQLHDDYHIGRFAIDIAQNTPPIPKAKDPRHLQPRKAKLMVMKELSKPRPTYLLTRGDFTRPDQTTGELTPGVFSKVQPALSDSHKRPSRLELAKWLIDPENPLTPRVTVNRIWMRYFGRGLVETEEDFGTQGSPPTHPELLDYLGRRFINQGWSMKKIHRLIVTSHTYQRSSQSRPDLAEIDPRNLYLARQSRLRLDAEILRDAALCSSGLLTRNIGGPSVFPPQPEGIYAFTQNRKSWNTSIGPDRYRRAMYTFFYRSAPYPLLSTFDAPDFQTVCTHRVRSNTPLQALTVANDPAFLEIAQALAARLIQESPKGLAEKINHAFELTLCRLPNQQELSLLSNYARQQEDDFSKDQINALALLNDQLRSLETSPSSAAALVCVARVLLNTDNFITRE